jgi:hypothetical protein
MDFANFQRRIHSLSQADGTRSDPQSPSYHSLLQADFVTFQPRFHINRLTINPADIRKRAAAGAVALHPPDARGADQ